MSPQLSAGRKVPDLQLAPSSPYLYSRISETSGRSELCWPSARNARATDAVLQPHTGFQITRSPHHPLHGSGIRAWMGCLGERDTARIIFCVPAGLYSKYEKQDAVSVNVQKYHFEQYVVKIDVDVHECV